MSDDRPAKASGKKAAAKKAVKAAPAKKAVPRKRVAPSIDDVYREQEQRLRTDLAVNRATFDHLGNRGGGVESAARAFFATHLPRRLSVGTGEIIDTEGNRSGQVDVIISNGDQPFAAAIDSPCLHLVEGVNASAEIKSKLDTRAMGEALATARLVKQLRPKPQNGDQSFTNPADRARFYEATPFFVLTFEQGLQPATVAQKINSAEWVNGNVGGVPALFPLIDAVFILGTGALIYVAPNEAYTFKSIAESVMGGWVFIETGDTLLQMLAWLSAVMPKVYRYAPISLMYLMGREMKTQLILPAPNA